ncbi:SRPBCC domain-containing protein [Paraburkholderia sp. BL21I4N1]|uniref:SRPBCC family protein n=1 Tax=Paraburkholderia sp. BL21I4N1 TaxID=1938801 RepID=UPI000CFE2060|nr:SRPBCC domain-containing protein [Paraburkholderia sp. BL21I4N1]PQV47469.1 uncharacterized protein YndB with AHSA1/START domain [Paraburkholderia sp. BL21I4N1]
MPAQSSLTLQRRLNAAPAKVFRAWTEAAQLIKWMNPGDTPVVRAELDVRVDGRYSIVYRKADGRELEANGQYLEIVPDRKLVFTWRWRHNAEHESLVTVLLESDGDATWLTLTHERFTDQAQADDHRRGWSGGLDSLERYFA